MSSSQRKLADERLQAALEQTGARDPREFYRERLRELKEQNPEGYAEAVRYFESTLVPTIAGGTVEPLVAWTEYGRRLAEMSAPGRTMTIDPTGRAQPYEPPPAGDALILHLPVAATQRALLVSLPRALSPAQRATYDWLVAGQQKLRATD